MQPNRRLPNATVLDVVHEVDEEAALEEERERFASVPLKKPRFGEEEGLMNVRTMVFGVGASGGLRVG